MMARRAISSTAVAMEILPTRIGAGRLTGGARGRLSPFTAMAKRLTPERLAGLERNRYRGPV